MHWAKNRVVHPESKGAIVQRGRCPGCGEAVTFYYGESGQFCARCRKEAEAARVDDRAERAGRRKAEKDRRRS
jgi:uncharacterized protein (DUF983 family)